MTASRILFAVCAIALVTALASPAAAQSPDPQLLSIIQQDLAALGYNTGNTHGEMSTETAIAISQFQAEQGLDVTGQPSPQLAGVVKAAMKNNYVPAAAPAPAPMQQASYDADALNAAQQACLQEKIAAAQEAQKKKRGFGSLMRAVTRTASQLGNNEVAQSVAETSRDVYDVNATAQDLDSAAKDLGLTTDEIEACRNPQMPGGQ